MEALKEIINVLYWDTATLTNDDKLEDLNSNWYVRRFGKVHHMLGYLVKNLRYFPIKNLKTISDLLNFLKKDAKMKMVCRLI